MNVTLLLVSDGEKGATRMVCTFKFGAGQPHEDPVDAEALVLFHVSRHVRA